MGRLITPVPRKPTIALDFDGVIHAYTSGWKGAHIIPDPIVPGACRAIENYQIAGYRVAIYSTRSKSLRGRRAMQAYLERHIIEHFGVDRVGADDCYGAIQWPWFKPPALITIDDRAWRFTGMFPTVDEIKAFRTWQQTGGFSPRGGETTP